MRRVREAHRFCVLCRQTGSTQLINNGGTPLMYAAEKGQLAVMDVLIKAGAALDVQSTCDNTALICAAVRGHNEAVARLIEAKATVDIPGEGAGTAMMKAAHGYYTPAHSQHKTCACSCVWAHEASLHAAANGCSIEPAFPTRSHSCACHVLCRILRNKQQTLGQKSTKKRHRSRMAACARERKRESKRERERERERALSGTVS